MKMRFLLSSFILFSINCTPVWKNKGSSVMFDKEAHRGGRGLMPENTIPAMINAVNLGATTLELDVVITADKQVVVSHEPFFSPDITTKEDGTYVTGGEAKSLNIYRMTYEEVTRYDVGSKPHPRFPRQQKLKVTKPLLGDLIDSVERYCQQHHLPPVQYNIETKLLPVTDRLYHPPPVEFVDLLVKVLLPKKIERRIIIQSFDFRTLQYLHRAYPLWRTAMLIDENDKRSLEDQLAAIGFIPSVYSPYYTLVNAALIKKCHQQKIKVIPWTVNELNKIKELKGLGADGVISDYPDLFKEL